MRLFTTFLCTTALLASASLAFAHTPLFSCFDNGDGTIMCQGGFSDGSSAAGVKIEMKNAAGAVVQEAVLDSNSEITLTKPAGDYSVLFNAGEGHAVEVSGENITE